MKKQEQKTYLAVIVAIIILGGFIWFWPGSNMVAPTTKNSSGGQKQTAKAILTSPIPATVEDFVTANISNISPVKASLGGTFHVTSVQAHGGAGTVAYEDGHNAYVVDFGYTIDEQGRPAITKVVMRNKPL